MSDQQVTLVGGGPVGSLLAIALAKRGYMIDVFERRPDIRESNRAAGRSINLALSARGIHALDMVGMGQATLDLAIPMLGRQVHPLGAAENFQPYGKDSSQYINSISRLGLNQRLITEAEATKKVKFHFQHRLTTFDPSKKTIGVLDEASGQKKTVDYNVLIGTDGSASELRAEAHRRGLVTTLSESTLDYGYKELNMPPVSGTQHALVKNALHIWPRGHLMIIALPNLDGSFTCTLFMPFAGQESFESISDEARLKAFFGKYFADTIEKIPNLSQEYFSNPTGRMTTVRSSPWHIAQNVLFLGDAAHAIVPFFGQGMNCGFEDVEVLCQALDQKNPIDEVFADFSKSRVIDSNAIADMALENFVEMRDLVAQPQFLLRKSVEAKLAREFSALYVPRYSLVTFERVPYSFAQRVGRAQDKVLLELCTGIQSADQVDLALARSLISQHIQPLLNERQSYGLKS